MNYKILIADDEKPLTELLQRQFKEYGYFVYTANSSSQVLELLRYQPDIILLDINMPDMNGLALCKSIRATVSCPILFLTARITEQDKLHGFRAGGDDYITKPFSLAELQARVEAHLRRERRGRESAALMVSHGLTINLSERTAAYDGTPISLTKTEFDIMELLSANPGQVFDRERIYEAVWGLEAGGDNSVVKEHIRKIRSKLSENAEWDFIETVWGMGYKWRK